MADAEDLLRLVQVTDVIDTPGRNMLEPGDVPLDIRHLVRALASIRMTDRVWAGEASSDVAAEDCLRMAEIVFGGAEAIAAEPVHLRATATSTRRCSSTRACSRGSSPTPRRARR